jgi:hypothetical protein
MSAAREAASQPVVGGGVVEDRGHGNVQVPTDDVGDLADRHGLVGDAVQDGARGGGFQREPE